MDEEDLVVEFALVIFCVRNEHPRWAAALPPAALLLACVLCKLTVWETEGEPRQKKEKNQVINPLNTYAIAYAKTLRGFVLSFHVALLQLHVLPSFSFEGLGGAWAAVPTRDWNHHPPPPQQHWAWVVAVYSRLTYLITLLNHCFRLSASTVSSH